MASVGEVPALRDRTADVIGSHPFAVRILFGDERRPAYVVDERGAIGGPGVQVLTPLADRWLSRTAGVSMAELHAVAAHLAVDHRELLNLACQEPGAYARRTQQLAAAAGRPALAASDSRVLQALKDAVDQAQGLGPKAIVRAAMAYLSQPAAPGGLPYGRLIGHINHVLTNPGANPRCGARHPPIQGIQDLAPEGLTLWWVKEGSATIVFQVRAALDGDRPPVRFVLNVAKDLTEAAAEVRRTHGDFTELYRMDPRSVMEPLGSADPALTTWRGKVPVAALAAEWFDGHELHVYEGSSQLYVWQDQHMGREHPIPLAVSDRIWEQVTRMRARYTRITPAGLLPIATHVNAGDYIFRERADGEWDVLLIWTRRAPAGVPPEEYVVLAGLLPGVSVFGGEVGRAVWWDQPARSLAALREGLAQAGLDAGQINALLRRCLEGVFARYAEEPEQLPHIGMVQAADPGEFRQVFQRAREAVAAHLAAAG